jgi:hypothetical protein
MLKVGRQTRGLGAKALLQPFSHGVADRSAGLAIDGLAVVGDSAIHGGSAFRWFQRVTQHQFMAMEIVSRNWSIAYFSSKNCMKKETGSVD